ncbi:MAG: 2-C-methyl-D-erythritol 4-phosphate cytidylyltransferase [Pyrinomonadaceae bacterium]
MNTAIIVAAGSGQRFSASQPKQFVNVLGKPLIVHTLERFEACPSIDNIVLVLSEEGRDDFERIDARQKVTKLQPIVIGGDTRADSVQKGFHTIDNGAANIIAVHDGARPMVTVAEITRTIEAADKVGAACLVAEVTDTIKRVNRRFISATVDRQRLRRALTPQAFKYDVLKRAYESNDLNETLTDECMLVERLGVKIAFVEGSRRNIKITLMEDLILAAAFLKDL